MLMADQTFGRLGGMPTGNRSTMGSPMRPASGALMGRAMPFSYKKGGTVKRGGLAKVHKGEKVIPAKFAKAKSVLGGKKKTYPKVPKAKKKVQKTMDEWKSGTLHSGSKKGPVVKNQKQAVAIALSQARKA